MDKFLHKNLNKILSLTVFVSGAAVMMVELIGSRILAPYVGTSLIPWTALVGVILGSLSIGYWLGGRLADIKPSQTKFGLIILLSGVSVALLLWQTLLLKEMAPLLIHYLNLGFAALFCASFLFFIPSVLLGIITPYALRLALTDLVGAGKTAGSLYAYSTLGSIAGTFAAGFIFIPLFGSFKTLTSIAVILILLSLIYFRNKLSASLLILVILSSGITFYNNSLFYPSNKIIDDQESFYNRLFIVKSNDEITSKPTLVIMSGPHLSQSARFADGSNDLVFRYTKFFRLVDYWVVNNNKVLMLGGGAYSVPRDYLSRHDKATIDVAEIDPLYTSIAKQYFNLKSDPRLNIYHQDARIFLADKAGIYDAVFVDVFNGSGSVPFHLATKEAVEKIKDSLNNQGVVVVNLIGSVDGLGSDFIKSEYATYSSVFDNVKVFPLNNSDPKALQNIMLVALKNENWPKALPKEMELANLMTYETSNISSNSRLLTDDWAPVDYFLAEVF